MADFETSYPEHTAQYVERFMRNAVNMITGQSPCIYTSNRKYDNIGSIVGNLGSSISFERPIIVRTSQGLTPTYQGSSVPKLSLTIDQAESFAFAMNPEEKYYNLDDIDWAGTLEKAGVANIAAKVELSVANQYTKAYRWFGDWDEEGNINAFNSNLLLGKAGTYFREYGLIQNTMSYGILPSSTYDDIMGNAFGQYAPKRNDRYTSFDWYEQTIGKINWLSSISFLPIHYAGVCGANGVTLKVVSVNDPAGKNVTQVTCIDETGALGTVADAVVAGDAIIFDKAGSLRYSSWVGGQKLALNKVTNSVKTTANATASTVVIELENPLSWDESNHNISGAITAGMTVHIAPDHRIGIVFAEGCVYLACPKTWGDGSVFRPQDYALLSDSEFTGISVAYTSGYDQDQNIRKSFMRMSWGTQVETHGMMKILLPV